MIFDDDEDVTADQIESFKDEDDTIKRFERANWDLMSYSDKEKYKKAQANRAARQLLGISKSQWPTGKRSSIS